MCEGQITGLQAGHEWRFCYAPTQNQIRTPPPSDKSTVLESASALRPKELTLSPSELARCETISEKIDALREFLSDNALVKLINAREWVTYLASLRDILGNVSNDIGFVATLLVKGYLEQRFAITNFDASSKPQGASGIDIEATAGDGSSIHGELKTNKPVQARFGGEQRKRMLNDLARLAASRADYRFMFVADAETYRIFSTGGFPARAPGVELLNLLTGDSFVFPGG